MSKYLPKIIIILGLILRLAGLNLTPPHLSNDEISIAYDAYSISRNFRGEHGTYLPLSFQSHGTYKAPLYTYILAPIQYILGNKQWVARLP